MTRVLHFRERSGTSIYATELWVNCSGRQLAVT